MFVLILSVVCISSAVYAEDDITLVINGEKVESDVSPMIINSRTMVPVRVLFSAFGADVVWNDIFRQVVVTTDNSVIIFTIDSKIAYVNGYSKTLDAAATIINGRTLVPVRFVSEALGYEVDWHASKRIVYITGSEPEKEPEQAPVVKPDNKFENNTSSDDSELKSVNVQKQSGQVSISVKLDKSVTPKVMTLSSPDRIVFDFYGAKQICDDSKVLFEDFDVTAVRWASHEDYARIVVESKTKLKYSVDSSGSVCKIIVYTSNNSSTVPITPSTAPVDTPSYNKNAPLVVVDAGHGGKDCGAVGRDENGDVVVYEAHVNLDISLRVQQRLINNGINVIMTRTTDVSLGDVVMSDLVKRADIANDANADLFISVHNNSHTTPDATGTTVLYAGLANSGNYGISSYELAQIMQDELVDATGLKDRGLTKSPGIVVLKRTDMPAVLLECGFVSSYNDQKFLTDNDKLNEIADAICDGIITALKKMGKL